MYNLSSVFMDIMDIMDLWRCVFLFSPLFCGDFVNLYIEVSIPVLLEKEFDETVDIGL